MTPDTPNLADAILIALSNAGWIGRLVPKGSTAPVTKVHKRRNMVRTPKAIPIGLTIPRGVTWNKQNGRFHARIWTGAGGKTHISIGTCAPVQAELDALGERWARLSELRSAGATESELREAV